MLASVAVLSLDPWCIILTSLSMTMLTKMIILTTYFGSGDYLDNADRQR